MSSSKLTALSPLCVMVLGPVDDTTSTVMVYTLKLVMKQTTQHWPNHSKQHILMLNQYSYQYLHAYCFSNYLLKRSKHLRLLKSVTSFKSLYKTYSIFIKSFLLIQAHCFISNISHMFY